MLGLVEFGASESACADPKARSSCRESLAICSVSGEARDEMDVWKGEMTPLAGFALSKPFQTQVISHICPQRDREVWRPILLAWPRRERARGIKSVKEDGLNNCRLAMIVLDMLLVFSSGSNQSLNLKADGEALLW
ncbi:hypothetical protein SRHO_G00264540 [Serrasalmus rhombeus]